MAHSFKTPMGKNTFGVFKEPQTSGDYILNKKSKTTFCKANNCVPSKSVGSEGNLNLLARSNRLSYYNCKNTFNKRNLNVNLITKLDLTNVPVIQDNDTGDCPTPLDNVTPDVPYQYTIDPSGNLFGKTTCGINNWVNRMVYNPPQPKYIFILLPETDALANPDADNLFNVDTLAFTSNGMNFVSTHLASLIPLTNSHFNWYDPLVYGLRQMQGATLVVLSPPNSGLYTVDMTNYKTTSTTAYFNIKTTALINYGNIIAGQVLTIGYMIVDTTTVPGKVIELWELANYPP
jgi:hypothetical protein